MLYELGMTAALEWRCEQAEPLHGLQAQLHCRRPAPRLDTDLEVFVFQAVQELLIHARTNARAENAVVSVEPGDAAVVVAFEHDGDGLDASAASDSSTGSAAVPTGFAAEVGALWLFSIRERLEYRGGRMQIESLPERGSRVVLHVPHSLVAVQPSTKTQIDARSHFLRRLPRSHVSHSRVISMERGGSCRLGF